MYVGNDKGYIVVALPDMETGNYRPWAILQLPHLRWLCTLGVPLRRPGRTGGHGQVPAKEPIHQPSSPSPNAPDADREALGALAQEITTEAKARYALHEKVRHRLRADLGTPDLGLNQKLTAWWTLDFAGLQKELLKVFKKTIPVKERDEWEAWFREQCTAHQRHTDAIIERETDLNARVYALFDLAAEEIKLIEAATKYKYGEV